LALREVERRLGLAERLAACIDDTRAAGRVRHGVAAILRFRMLMIAAGYEDGNDADALRHDPVFKLALDRLPDDAALCSQPTISRLENLPGRRALPRMAQAIYDERAWDRLGVLADAVEDAGCSDATVVAHLRSPGPHVRGCWALDLLMGK